VACYLGKAKNPNASILEMLKLFTHKFCGRALLLSKHSLAYCRTAESMRVESFAKTWIGVNFVGTMPVCLKLYFTAYEPLSSETVLRMVGDSSISASCLQLMNHIEPCLDPNVAGSGYTICFKLSLTGKGASAFHTHVGNNGLYRHFTDEGWHDKHYHYASDRANLKTVADRIAMPCLHDCRELELASGRSHGFVNADDAIKIVPVGDFCVFAPRMYTEEEQNVIACVDDRFPIVATCGGVYSPPVLKSVYFVARERVRTFSAFVD
jgi:hypothetical protein